MSVKLRERKLEGKNSKNLVRFYLDIYDKGQMRTEKN